MHIRAEEIIDAKVKVSDITGLFVEKFFRNGDDEKQAGNAFEHSPLTINWNPPLCRSSRVQSPTYRIRITLVDRRLRVPVLHGSGQAFVDYSPIETLRYARICRYAYLSRLIESYDWEEQGVE